MTKKKMLTFRIVLVLSTLTYSLQKTFTKRSILPRKLYNIQKSVNLPWQVHQGKRLTLPGISLSSPHEETKLSYPLSFYQAKRLALPWSHYELPLEDTHTRRSLLPWEFYQRGKINNEDINYQVVPQRKESVHSFQTYINRLMENKFGKKGKQKSNARDIILKRIKNTISDSEREGAKILDRRGFWNRWQKYHRKSKHGRKDSLVGRTSRNIMSSKKNGHIFLSKPEKQRLLTYMEELMQTKEKKNSVKLSNSRYFSTMRSMGKDNLPPFLMEARK